MAKKKVDKNELVKMIINELGVEVNNDNIVIDQDSQNILAFNGKKLKMTNDPSNIGKGETLFDPLSNRKLMSNLLAFGNEKMVEDDVCEPISIMYCLDPNADGKSAMEIRDSLNNTFTSKEYYNDSLKMADLLFQMAGNKVDLTPYDEKIIPIVPKKKPCNKK